MIIGLTGRSGAGKSTVCAAFRENGFFVIDADRVSKEVSETDRAKALLRISFGEGIFENGVLNRKKLGDIVFSDKEKLKKLNEVLLPLIIEEIESLISSVSSTVLIDAPTLFESGLYKKCDLIISVSASDEVLISRIMKRDSLTEKDAVKRISSQLSDGFFRENSDIVIENNGSESELIKKAQALIDKILQ